MSDALGIGILIAGLFFNLIGCIGLIRLPDIYNRLQAATKCVTLGTCLVLASVMVLAEAGSVQLLSKCLLCLIFVLITAPTAAHALARGAHSSGVKLWDKSIVDRYQEDREPEVAEGTEQ